MGVLWESPLKYCSDLFLWAREGRYIEGAFSFVHLQFKLNCGLKRARFLVGSSLSSQSIFSC